MAENRSNILSEAELRGLREILYRARANDVDSLQRQVKSIGVGLAELLVKAVSALESGLQDTRSHLKIAVETMMEQAEEIEQIKAQVGSRPSGIPSAFPFPPGGGDAAEARGRLEETERHLIEFEGQLAGVREGLAALSQRLDQAGADPLIPQSATLNPHFEGLLERLVEHVHLLSLAEARKVARLRVARGKALARVAEAIEQVFLPRVVAFRRELSGDVAAYDGCRGIEDRARETCEDLRRESQRLVQMATADAERLNASPAEMAERLECARDLLALGAVAEGEDDLDFELRRVLSQWLTPLIDLTVEYRETTGAQGQAAFHALLGDLMAAGLHAGLDAIVPARGAPFDPVLHETDDPVPGGGARVTRVVAPGYRVGGGVLRLAKVRLVE